MESYSVTLFIPWINELIYNTTGYSLIANAKSNLISPFNFDLKFIWNGSFFRYEKIIRFKKKILKRVFEY